MENLDKVKKTLEEKLSKLTVRVENIESDLREPHDTDWDDDATESQNDETLEGIESVAMEEIVKIKSALSKINDGKYGKCEECGNVISQKRLEAIPYAIKCVACLESEQ